MNQKPDRTASMPRRDALLGLGVVAAAAPAAARAASSRATRSGELAGKAAVVTGASRNLGRAFAVALARQGADVLVHYHTEKSRADAEETAKMIRSSGSKAVLVGG